MKIIQGQLTRYSAGVPPTSAEDLPRFIRDELSKVQASIGDVADGQIDTTHTAPTKPRQGMIRLADGTSWNPGSGEGLYVYLSSVWHPLSGGGGGVVTSINTRTGAVTLTSADVGLASADNTSDVNKPVSTAQALADTSISTAAASDATTKANAAQAAAIAASAPVSHVGTGGVAHANVVAAGAAGFMTGADKTKLDGVATGATANTGTVTTASVITGNGFAGTVANPTTAPAITLTTSVTGIIKGNGISMSAATVRTDYAEPTTALATGILKNTTGTGAHTIAVAGDFPTLNQSTTGNAATVTTNANLTGEVTSTGNATTVTNAAVIGKVLTGYVSGAGSVAATDTILQAVNKLNGNDALRETASNKNASGGYAGLTLFKLNLRNAANTITSWFTTAATVARTWTLPDKDGTVAMTSDITGSNSGTNTGDNSANTTYAADYRAANFVAGTNYLAPTGSASGLTGLTSTQVTTALGYTPGSAAGLSTSTISTNTTATAGGVYVMTASLTLTLPASPAAGNIVRFSNMSGTTTCVIGRNGQNIMGLAESLTVDQLHIGGGLMFADATRGWVFV